MKYVFAPLLAVLTALSFNADAQSVWDPQKPRSIVEKKRVITVYRGTQCACCVKWLDHVKKHNFTIKENVSNDMGRITSSQMH